MRTAAVRTVLAGHDAPGGPHSGPYKDFVAGRSPRQPGGTRPIVCSYGHGYLCMRAVVQRVSEASVVTDGSVCGSIRTGLLVYLGADREDHDGDVVYLADKVRHLRIFADDAGKMNLDVGQIGGKVLVVSAFTVQADARRGRRPSFVAAAEPARALALYQQFCDALANTGIDVQRGSFGDYMQVRAVNDGPICILLESRRAF